MSTRRPQPGDIWTDAKGRTWGVCVACNKLVRVDKRILGSAHFCGRK